MPSEPIVAVALLTANDLQSLGANLSRVYRVDDDPGFDDLLRQLDAIDAGEPQGRGHPGDGRTGPA